MLQFWRTEVYLLIKNPSAVNERVHSFNNFGTSIKINGKCYPELESTWVFFYFLNWK